MSNKLKNTRIVTFKEDYKVIGASGKRDKVIYEKDSEHAIHYKTVESLEKRGAKMTVKQVK